MQNSSRRIDSLTKLMHTSIKIRRKKNFSLLRNKTECTLYLDLVQAQRFVQYVVGNTLNLRALSMYLRFSQKISFILTILATIGVCCRERA